MRFFLKAISNKLKTRAGQGTLALALLVGSVVLIASTTIAFLLTSFAVTSGGFYAANRALSLASAGAQDAILELARNVDYGGGTYCSFENCGASVVVAASTAPNIKVITSSATVLGATRKIQAIVSLNTVTGAAQLVSWRQLEI